MSGPNADQDAYWNDQAGHSWAELQLQLDAQIAPLGARAIEALAPREGEHILDIGCGCGDTTLQLARQVGPNGAVCGVDLSAPMLEVAQRRAVDAGLPGVSFQRADAQVARFAAPFGAAFSRFGVMFFADPVAAFANIRAALRPGGRLAFVCWRKQADNPWMMVPLQAALRHVPPPPPSNPEDPGPFAFANSARICSILSQAGFADISTEPFNLPIGGFALEQALGLALRIGPLGKLLREAPQHREAAIDDVRAALAAHATKGGIFLGSGTWIVTARV